MATLELLGFGSTGWGALLILAALMTLAVTATALAIGAVLGAIVAGAKLSGNPLLVAFGNVYTTVFRGVPELLIIYLIYFGGSSAVTSIGKAMGYEGFLGLPSFAAARLPSASSPAPIRRRCSAAPIWRSPRVSSKPLRRSA